MKQLWKSPNTSFSCMSVCVCVRVCCMCVFHSLKSARPICLLILCLPKSTFLSFSSYHFDGSTHFLSISQEIHPEAIQYNTKCFNILQNFCGWKNLHERTNGRSHGKMCMCVYVHKCVCVRECFNIKVTLINSFYSSSNVMGNDDAFMVIWLVLHFPCNILSLWLFPNEWTGRALELGWLLNKVEW